MLRILSRLPNFHLEMNTDLTLERLPATFKRPHSVHNQSFLAKFIPRDRWYQFTIIWSLLQFIVVGILEGIIVKIHYDYVQKLKEYPQIPNVDQTILTTVPNAQALIVYQSLFICAQAFQLFLCIDAITSLSVIQIIAVAVFNWSLFGYSIMQYNQASNVVNENISVLDPIIHPTAKFEIVVIGLMVMFSMVWAYLAFKLYKLFGWKLYKEIGADVSIMKSLRLYHIYMMLLKLDTFFFFGFDIQFLVLVLISRPGRSVDTSVTVTHMAAVIPLTIILLAVAFFAVRKESRKLTYITLVGFFAGIFFLIAKVIEVWTNSDPGKYLNSKKSITFFSKSHIQFIYSKSYRYYVHADLYCTDIQLLEIWKGLKREASSLITLPLSLKIINIYFSNGFIEYT